MTSLPRSTHCPTASRASRLCFLMYSLPSLAVLRMASRVSRPERGAYNTPKSAPKPSPARNHMKLLLLSLSDMLDNLRSSDGSTQNGVLQIAEGSCTEVHLMKAAT